MNFRRILLAVVGVAVLALAGFSVWLFRLPPQQAQFAPPPVSQEEARATLAALQPPKRQRPLISIVGINDATETTDYLMTYGILRRADVADVMLLSTESGPVSLYPALAVEPDTTIAQFDMDHPDGADYVIVPQMSRHDDAALHRWLKKQQAGGATILGICGGATVVAAGGLLDGKRATTHWYYRKEILRDPSVWNVAKAEFQNPN